MSHMSDYSYESKRITRAKRIDSLLTAAGWTVSPYDAAGRLTAYHRHAVIEHPTANGLEDARRDVTSVYGDEMR